MPSLGNCTVSIRSGGFQKKELANGYVPMNHNQEYSLYLRNNAIRRCNAEVTIDGQRVGTFRIQPQFHLIVERPVNVAKKFHFYRSGTTEAFLAGIRTGESENGHIKVTFTPEKGGPVRDFRGVSADACLGDDDCLMQSNSSYASGATGLQGHSFQNFANAATMTMSPAEAITIHLRLVAESSGDNNAIEPLRPLERETQIPPPVRDETQCIPQPLRVGGCSSDCHSVHCPHHSAHHC